MRVFVLIAVVITTTAAAPAVDWASQPVAPDQTVLLLGGPFKSTSNISIAGKAVEAIQANDGSVKFTVPALSMGQWPVTVDGSEPYTLNAPQPWWVSGDLRQFATAGGYVRVFGSCVHFTSAAVNATKLALHNAEAAVLQLVSHGTAEDTMTMMGRMRELAAARQAYQKAVEASSSTLRLMPTQGGQPITVQSNLDNSTDWSAWFTLPASIPAGNYTVSIANHLNPDNLVTLGSFGSYVSASEPNVTTITVLSSQEVGVFQPWKRAGARTFNVTDYGPHGLPGCGPGQGVPTCPINNATGKPWSSSMYWVNASASISAALAAAEAAGGGTVFLPRGTYFINSTYGFTIPWGVRLMGEGKDLVELIFSETYGVSSAGPIRPFGPGSGAIGYFRDPSNGTGSWAVSDLTVYMTAFHNTVFRISKRSVGFEMQRVRATVNSFFGGNGPNKGRSPQANVSWGMTDMGPLISVLGTNYLIEDCDLYSDGDVITSTTTDSPCPSKDGNKTAFHHCHGSAWGSIRNNNIFNGRSSHFMAQWKQIIFENNTVSGISPLSGGQSLGTGPGGGRCHHVYHGKNVIRWVESNDREIITYDDAGAAYLGRVAGTSADGLTLTLASDARSSLSGEWLGWDGAAVTVLNGTGAGTYRRVTHSGIDASDNPGEFFNPHNRTWRIDRAFSFPLTEDQVISITPARSRVIFESDHFADGGTFQFYGQAQECVVDSLTGERMSGVVAWGQWRGWYTPPCGTMGQPPCPNSSVPSLGGEMGNGIMMNTQLTYRRIRFTVGQKIVRWSAMGGGSYLPGFGKFYNGATFNIQAVSIRPSSGADCKREPEGKCHDWSQLAATAAVVYRDNVVLSNGGFNIANSQHTINVRDVIIEDNTVQQSDKDKAMQVSPSMTSANGTVFLRKNSLP